MNEGDKAPQFALLDQDGKTVKLSDHAGETVVLYFTLVGDPDHSVAEAYGTWVEKSMYGKKYMGIQRATFIIGPDGKIARAFKKVSPKTHDDVILKALGELRAAA